MNVKRNLWKIMSVKHNFWKTLVAFTTSAIAAIFGFGSSKALSVETKTLSEPTIEERLANIREQLKQREKQVSSQSNPMSSPSFSPKTKEEYTVSQSWNDTAPSPSPRWRDSPNSCR